MNSNSGAEHGPNGGADDIPATPQPEAELVPHRIPLVPERSDFLDGDAPAAAKVGAFLAQALAVTGTDAPTTAGALVPWICDALLSNHSVKAYGRDLMDFLRHMQAQGVDPLQVTADHVKFYVRFVASFRPVMRYAKEGFRHYPMFRHRSATPAGVTGNGGVRSLGDNVTSILGSVVDARADTATASITAVGGQQSGARPTQVKCRSRS